MSLLSVGLGASHFCGAAAETVLPTAAEPAPEGLPELPDAGGAVAPQEAAPLDPETALGLCQMAEETFERDAITLPVLQMLSDCADLIRAPLTRAHFLHLRGDILATIGVLDDARRDLETATALDETEIRYALSLGALHLRREEPAEALAAFKAASRLDRSNSAAMAGIGRAHLAEGNLMAADAFISRALEKEPTNHSALMDRARIALYQGEPLQAEEALDAALAVSAEDGEAFLLRGIARTATGATQEALSDFNEAVRLMPANASALTNRGAFLARLKRDDEAIADFDRALEINPGTADALYGRGLVKVRHVRKRDRSAIESAVRDLKQAITLDPTNDQLGAAMAALEKLERF